MKTRLRPRIQLLNRRPAADDLLGEILDGLHRTPRRLPCKLFYDERGSQLFDLICELDEYYPTRTELGILREHIGDIAAACGPRVRLVELGSGSSLKTRLLLDHLEAPVAYVPIDISGDYLLGVAQDLARAYPHLEIRPVCADYGRPLELPEAEDAAERTTWFFPGSTIGNFEPEEAVAFLRRVGASSRAGDRLLIGIDLAKSRVVLEPAYNDRYGVTAAFNLNVLWRLNAEFGGTFDLDQFTHRAVYRPDEQRVEMHLVSNRAQTPTLAEVPIPLAEGESIVTEYSYKYAPDRFERLAARAGWAMFQRWTDPRGWFSIVGLEWGGES